MRKSTGFSRLMHNKATPLFFVLLALIIVTMILSSGVLKGAPFSAMFTQGFMSKSNLRNVFYALVIQIFMRCGLASILISGNIDLSVATQATMSVMVFAWLHQNTPLPWYVVLIITLIAAVCMGLINTFLCVKLGFPAFIATIGMSSVYRGLCNVMTNGYNITLSQSGILTIGKSTVFGILPVTFVIAIIFVIVFQFILSRTNFGRSVFMAGGNRNAARLAGLNPNRITMILFIVNSIMAALGGLCWIANIGTASPTAIVQDAPDMSVISASILGGVAFMGGSGNLIGPLIAVLLLNTLENMLNVLGVNPYWNVFAQGALLAIALAFDFISEQRRRRELLAR